MTISTPDLCDQYESEIKVLEPIFHHYGGKKYCSGEISTVLCENDNSLVAERLHSPGAGKILVVDGKGSRKYSLLGDKLAHAAIDNCWSGILINGCLRDVEILGGLPITILALGSIPKKTIKLGKGSVDVPLSFAGVDIHPKNYLYADLSGVIISRKKLTF
jgi:regulator of ribonuclease activity A